jgi:MFS family permease
MASDRLFTPRFFLMCGFSFTVFLSAFQLLPTAPYRILDLGGTAAVAGLFLGFLTYSSALTAPITGSLVDRFGPRHVMIIAAVALAGFSLLYSVLPGYHLMLTLVVVHGFFWSGLLSASGTYISMVVPGSRRAEGIGYWGLSTVLAASVAPTIGLWVYGRGGWTTMCLEAAAINLVMAAIAWALPADETRRVHRKMTVEWRVLVLSVTLFMYAFGYGGITSFVALYTDANGVTPSGLYFIVFCLTTVVTRPFSGRLGDRIGYRRVFLPCVALVALAFALLAAGGSKPMLITSAMVFGTGFGSAYPVFLAYLMQHVDESRRGAMFGSIIGAFDTGIGTGSIVLGSVVQRSGYQTAWATCAVLAACAIPYFLIVERRVLAPSRTPTGEYLRG